jgi:hypothetical protein
VDAQPIGVISLNKPEANGQGYRKVFFGTEGVEVIRVRFKFQIALEEMEFHFGFGVIGDGRGSMEAMTGR